MEFGNLDTPVNYVFFSLFSAHPTGTSDVSTSRKFDYRHISLCAVNGMGDCIFWETSFKVHFGSRQDPGQVGLDNIDGLAVV